MKNLSEAAQSHAKVATINLTLVSIKTLIQEREKLEDQIQAINHLINKYNNFYKKVKGKK